MINEVLGFWKDLWEWVYKVIQGLWRVVSIKRVSGVKEHPVGYFKKGEIVVSRDGNIGRVWRIYRKIKNNKIVGCSVIWETPYQGQKVSPFLPAEDVTPRFNPHIKRYENK